MTKIFDDSGDWWTAELLSDCQFTHHCMPERGEDIFWSTTQVAKQKVYALEITVPHQLYLSTSILRPERTVILGFGFSGAVVFPQGYPTGFDPNEQLTPTIGGMYFANEKLSCAFKPTGNSSDGACLYFECRLIDSDHRIPQGDDRGRRLAGSLILPATIAGVVVGSVLACIVLVAFIILLRRRIRRRRRQIVTEDRIDAYHEDVGLPEVSTASPPPKAAVTDAREKTSPFLGGWNPSVWIHSRQSKREQLEFSQGTSIARAAPAESSTRERDESIDQLYDAMRQAGFTAQTLFERLGRGESGPSTRVEAQDDLPGYEHQGRVPP
ncbi:hypothetical protein BKA62DRAFT_714730 [Auriculariales sp. MPI-PUGE-AT-0066]|nr:hypothetical protein BKA62DRAFT_714730 [Auriculariales sp. MPI-PUGE-AT-0066]